MDSITDLKAEIRATIDLVATLSERLDSIRMLTDCPDAVLCAAVLLDAASDCMCEAIEYLDVVGSPAAAEA